MAIPTGTITLLFSDIEGSTRLWENSPQSMAVALERHDRLMRDAMEGSSGYIFKTIGDAFCVAFATAPEALRAGLGAQASLQNESWPPDTFIRVRMALHTGVCQERDGDYFGPAVNRTARLMAVAHGGQLVVSGVTAELLSDFSDDEGTLRDLGEHRLRDLGRPERIWQVESSGLWSDFPPLSSLDNPELPNNLPELLSSFVGRNEELREVRALIGQSRLVTLTGAGGSGKTRLATQAAAELLDGDGEGVWLVELAPVNDEALVPMAVASVLGIQDIMEVSPLESLVSALSNQNVLLILDNCEHLVSACSKFCDAVLHSCPRVHILATSREPLGMEGERVYRVPSMSLPSDDAEILTDLEDSDAVSLFLGRAREVDFVAEDHDASLVASICTRLDGIPLALELAAARLSSMSLSQLHDRLDQRFRLLTGGSRNVMARQQTLQAMVDWSYGLLNAAEQSVLRRTSVFVDGFTLEAAESVCSSDLVDEFDVGNVLHSLVAKSLVVADKGIGSVRFRLLETIRQYGAQKLLEIDGDETVLDVRDRHAEYFVALALAGGEGIYSPRHFEATRSLDLESENLRATLAHLSMSPSGCHDVLRVFVALEWFLLGRASYELIPYLEKAVKAAGRETTELTTAAVIALGRLVMAFSLLDDEKSAEAAVLASRGLVMAQEVGALTLESSALSLLAFFAGRNHQIEEASELVHRSIATARLSGDGQTIAGVLYSALGGRVGDVAFTEEQSRAILDEVRAIWTAAGYQSGLAAVSSSVALLAFKTGDFEVAEREWRSALIALEASGAYWWARSPRVNLGLVLATLGKFDEAVPMMRQALRDARRSGFRTDIGPLVEFLAYQALHEGDPKRAARLFGAGQTLSIHGLDIGTLGPNTEFEDQVERELEESIRHALGEDNYSREYALGAELNASQATELALVKTTAPARVMGDSGHAA